MLKIINFSIATVVKNTITVVSLTLALSAIARDAPVYDRDFPPQLLQKFHRNLECDIDYNNNSIIFSVVNTEDADAVIINNNEEEEEEEEEVQQDENLNIEQQQPNIETTVTEEEEDGYYTSDDTSELTSSISSISSNNSKYNLFYADYEDELDSGTELDQLPETHV